MIHARAYIRGEIDLPELARRMTGAEPYEISNGRLRWKPEDRGGPRRPAAVQPLPRPVPPQASDRESQRRQPCGEDLAALDTNAESAVAALAAINHPDTNLYAERLRVARGLFFTDCARRARLRAIIQDCHTRRPMETIADMPP